MSFQKMVKSIKEYADDNGKTIDLNQYVKKEDLNNVAYSGEYKDLKGTPVIDNSLEESGVLWDAVQIKKLYDELSSNKFDDIELVENSNILNLYSNGLLKKTLTIPIISTGGGSGNPGSDGHDGKDGVGIQSIQKTKTEGLVDTYTITFTNGSSTTFRITNGRDGVDGSAGKGIVKVEKVSTIGLVDNYKMTFSDNTEFVYSIRNGKDGVAGSGGGTGGSGKDGISITGVNKTGSAGLVDTYTINYSDGNTSTFNVTNGKDGKDGINGTNGRNGSDGKGILNVKKTATNENMDTYTITYTDGSSTQFTVSNGRNGSDGVDGKNGTIIKWKGEFTSHPENPEEGWCYKNTSTTPAKTYIYTDGNWYQMTIDGVNGQNGANGISIHWCGDLTTPPANPQINWCYRDKDNKKVYIYDGTAWKLMLVDGNDGVDGAKGDNGYSVYITYNDSATIPNKPTGNGTTNGWHTEATSSSVWMSQKVAPSVTEGEWGNPIKIKGDAGAPGRDGKDGTSISIKGSYGSKAELDKAHPSGNAIGDSYIVAGDLYIWDGTEFKNMGKIKGADGVSTYIHIKYSDDGFSFTANQGETIGAYIGIYVDSKEADSMNFSDYQWKKIVGQQGIQGVQGPKGEQGVAGNDGTTYFTWVKYADDANGNGLSDNPDGKEYIGLAYNKTTRAESTNKADYTWSKFRGDDGVTGPQGADGKTYYTWIKYADDANGNGISDNPDGKEYMGVAYNKETKIESTNPTDYTWSKFRGEDGLDGATSYFHIKYSNDGGKTFTDNNGETTGIYIGTYVDYNPTDSTNISSYTWHRLEGLQGPKGEQGIPGTNGVNGKTQYLHIKYSNDGGKTFTSNNGEDTGIYIGVLVDFNVNDSNTPSAYKWSKIKGENGEADENVLEMTYAELNSRNTSILYRVDNVLGMSLLADDIKTLRSYRSSVVNTFSSVTSAYNSLQTSKTSTNYNAYINAVESWNNTCALALACCDSAIQNKNTTELSNKLTNDRRTIFNILTNNDSDQGIFTLDDKIYINAEYIDGEDLNINNSINTKYLNVDYINCAKVPEMLQNATTVSVSVSGSDANDFEDGAIFRTLQGAIDACPICLNGNSVHIDITATINEDVEIRGKMGGTIYINCNGNNFKGNIKIWDCTGVLIYGGSDSASPSTRPSIQPANLYHYDGYDYSVIAIRTQYVYLKDINIYGKTNSSSSTNYAVGASRNAKVEARNVTIIGSDNGFMANRDGKIMAENCNGRCTRYGHAIFRGGQLSLVEGKAVGGGTANVYKKDGSCVANYTASEISFDSSSSVGSNNNSNTNTNTATYNSVNGYSYRTGDKCSYANTWSTDNVVRQGQYSPSMGYNKGLWFFGTAFNNVKGKTISKVEITVTRQKAGTYSSSANLAFGYHNYSSKPSGNATVSFVKNVSIPAYNGSKYTFTITDSSVLNGIKNGTIKGFSAYNSSGNGVPYMGFSAACKVTIYYK